MSAVRLRRSTLSPKGLKEEKGEKESMPSYLLAPNWGTGGGGKEGEDVFPTRSSTSPTFRARQNGLVEEERRKKGKKETPPWPHRRHFFFSSIHTPRGNSRPSQERGGSSEGKEGGEGWSGFPLAATITRSSKWLGERVLEEERLRDRIVYRPLGERKKIGGEKGARLPCPIRMRWLKKGGRGGEGSFAFQSFANCCFVRLHRVREFGKRGEDAP